MNKSNHLSFLKPVVCFVFFIIAGVVFGMKTIEPDEIKYTGEDFYIEHDKQRGLYFGMERISQENVNWWEARLAYEAYTISKLLEMHMEKYNSKENINAVLSRFTSFNAAFKIEKNYKFMSLFKRYINIDSDIKQCLAAIEENDRKVFELMNNGSFTEAKLLSEQNKEILAKIKSLQDLEKRIFPLRNYPSDYADAFDGFAHNLKFYNDGGEGATWVAYVSSKPVIGLLCRDNNFDVTSPDVKMAVTVKISANFYSPLGIYGSCIAKAFSEEPESKNLSMLLHAYVARAIERINPDAKYMLFRPLKSMLNLLVKSGITYSASAKEGKKQDIKLPHVCYKGGEHTNTHTVLCYAYDFVLFDPCNDIQYTISNKHWFSKSPFLGYKQANDSLGSYRFIVIDRINLGKYDAKAQVY